MLFAFVFLVFVNVVNVHLRNLAISDLKNRFFEVCFVRSRLTFWNFKFEDLRSGTCMVNSC